jgi:glycosyltransferase involved in cell wall biosynthesis
VKTWSASALPETEANAAGSAPRISIVIPLHNEASTLRELYRLVRTTMEQQQETWELVLVDDGSSDATLTVLRELHGEDPWVVVVQLRRNYGQTPALMAGFDNARGDIIISLDGDLQHNPEEIPNFLKKIDEGYDLVSGWRVARSDAFWTRTLPSRVANWLMARISGVELHDFGTTFKAYRREVLNDIHLYGELHRFVPALSAWSGARIVEIPIRDMGRNHGKSHYGLSRTFRVLLDLLTVGFLLRYMTRPLHFFGKLFFGCCTISGLMGIFLIYRKFFGGVHILKEHGPLTLFAAVLLLAGIQFLAVGLLGEILARIYFEGQDKKIYSVRNLLRRRRPGA